MMEKAPRVLLISPMPPPAGGIATWTNMIVGHAQNRSDVVISVLNTALRWRTPQQKSAWHRVAAGIPQTATIAASFLSRVLRKKVDVVHINGSGQFGLVRDLVLSLLANATRVPVIYHVRFGRVPEISRKRNLEWRTLASIIRRSRAVVVLDRSTMRTLTESMPEASIHHIPNCIDVEVCRSEAAGDIAGPDCSYVLFAGWVIPAKGIEELLAAWRAIAPIGWKLLVAGGFDPSYMRTIDAEAGRTNNIDFLGERPRSEVLALMSGCQIFVLPSHTEGFPNVVLEAMAWEKAVLATRVGAVGDILSDGAGVVVPPRSGEELRSALQELISDGHRRAELGVRARAKVDADYSLKNVFELYLALWSEAA